MIQRLYLIINDYRKWFLGIAGIAVARMIGMPLIKTLYDGRIDYDWENKYEQIGNIESDEPYGAKYYLEHIKEIWKDSVILADEKSDYFKTYRNKRCNFLIFNFRGDLNSDFYAILDVLGKGNNIIFCNFSYTYEFSNILSLDYQHNETFYISSFKSVNKPDKATLTYYGNKTEQFDIWQSMLEVNYFEAGNDTIEYGKYGGKGKLENLISTERNEYFAVRRHIGKGKALVNGVPLLYANYVLSVPELTSLSDDMLLNTFDRKLPLVVVCENDRDKGDAESGAKTNMFYVLFSHPATKVALYCLLAMMLFAIFVNSRRRRCPQKELNVQENSSLNYVRHLATLYSAKTDYKELLEIEQRKIMYNLRKEYRFDISTHGFTRPSEFAEKVAKSKNLDAAPIHEALETLESLVSGSATVSRNSYITCLQMLSETVYKTDK